MNQLELNLPIRLNPNQSTIIHTESTRSAKTNILSIICRKDNYGKASFLDKNSMNDIELVRMGNK